MTDTEMPAPRPMLRGELVWLRPTEPSDLIDEAPYSGDVEIGHFGGGKTPWSRASAERYINEFQTQIGDTTFAYAICPLGEQRGIGSIFLRNVDRVNGSAVVGIFISDRRFLGKGYGTDALNALVDFGFGELRLERIELEVFDYNLRAIRSYQKAGFQTDAVLRRARFHRGAHHDVLLMSILRDDWQAMPRKRSWELAEV